MAADQPDYTGNVYVTGGQVIIDTGGGPVNVQFEAPQQVEFATVQDVAISGVAQVEFAAAQEVYFTATGPVSVTDYMLPTNELVLLSKNQLTETDILNNQQITINGSANALIEPSQLGLYDGYFMVVHSSAGINYGTTGTVQGFVWGTALAGGDEGWTYDTYVTLATTPQPVWDGPAGDGVIGPAFWTQAWALSGLVVTLINTTGSTIATDTITIWFYGIRAQVQLNNPTSTPGYVQQSKGEFTAIATPLAQPTTVTTLATFIQALNGYATKMWLSIEGNGTGSCYLEVYVNGEQIDYVLVPQSGNVTRSYDFAQGVDVSLSGVELATSNGLSVTVAGGLTWYATAGALVPATLA